MPTTSPVAWLAAVTAEERASLGELDSARLQCLFILKVGAMHGDKGMVAARVADALQFLGIAMTHVGARNALDSAATAAPRLVLRNRTRPRVYSLAQPGERALAAVQGGNLAVIRIEANKPLTARVTLSAMLASLEGVVRISDPYYGARSADALTSCATNAKEVRLLTGACGGGENEGAAKRVLLDTMKEHRNVEVKLAPPKQLPHDRFVLTDDELILVGHGLKDIGHRESFVIRVPRPMLADTANQMALTFDSLWSASVIVKP